MFTSLAQDQTQTTETEREKGILLTFAKKFYIRRFPREEEAEGSLTREEYVRILRGVSRPEEPEPDEEM